MTTVVNERTKSLAEFFLVEKFTSTIVQADQGLNLAYISSKFAVKIQNGLTVQDINSPPEYKKEENEDGGGRKRGNDTSM